MVRSRCIGHILYRLCILSIMFAKSSQMTSIFIVVFSFSDAVHYHRSLMVWSFDLFFSSFLYCCTVCCEQRLYKIMLLKRLTAVFMESTKYSILYWWMLWYRPISVTVLGKILLDCFTMLIEQIKFLFTVWYTCNFSVFP